MSIANNNIVARVAAVGAGLALVASSFAFAPAANAQSSASLEAQIAALMAQIAALQAQAGGSASASVTFTRDLTLGSSGADVTALQNWLIANGASIPAGATGYFGAQTQAALAKWQASVGITPAAGYFGPITRAKVNASAGGSTGGNGGSTGGNMGGDLEGGAGDIEDAEFVSSLNSEEVGEDEEDVEVAGLEIEADGSDIKIVAVTLVFDESTGATDDFEDYATEVSVWFDGEEVARVDASEFDEDDDYEQTISLEEDAIIREGDTGELTVAVSAVSNLDSDQEGDDWDVAFASVRFMDAQGATVTDSSTGDIDDTVPAGATSRGFSFETFATAADVELNISEGDDEVNDAQSLEIDEDAVTNDVELLSFELEAEGDSDILIKEFGVNVDMSTGTSTDVISDIRLVIDGEEFDGDYQATTSNSDDYVFEDVDFTIEAGETVEAMIVADIEGTDDFDETKTLTVEISSDDYSLIDAEDESGEDLTDSEISGSASAGAFTFGESGIMVEAVSTDADANDGETVGTFEIVVDVTAYGDDLYIYNGADDAQGTAAGFVYTVYANGTATTSFGTLGDLVTSTADESGSYYEIREGETEQFTLTVTVDPSAGNGAIYNVELDTLHHKTVATGDANDGDVVYTIPSSEDVETSGQNLVQGS